MNMPLTAIAYRVEMLPEKPDIQSTHRGGLSEEAALRFRADMAKLGDPLSDVRAEAVERRASYPNHWGTNLHWDLKSI